MKAERAWLNARDSLRQELNKAEYDTWAAPARLLRFNNNTFEIGVLNEYNRDWLEDRLTERLEELLSGQMEDCPYPKVRFVLLQGQEIPPPNPQQETLTVTQTETQTGGSVRAQATHSAHSTQTRSQPVHSPDSAQQNLKQNPALVFQARYSQGYQEIVKPNKVVVLPGYFRQFLPYLGSTGAWVYTACYQLSFLNDHPNTSVRIRALDVEKWSGLSARTFWRELGENDFLGHLIQLDRDPPDGEAPYTDSQGRRYKTAKKSAEGSGEGPKREANRYFVRHSLPLVPYDSDNLQAWCLKAGLAENPIQTLEKALRTPVKELMPPQLVPYNFDLADPSHTPRSVQESVLAVCPRMDEDESLVVQSLLTSLENHIHNSYGHLFISWYFIQHWVGLLGAQKAWAVVLGRKAIYVNQQTSERRTSFRKTNGVTQIAWELRINKPYTISAWFKAALSRRGKPEWINAFMEMGQSRKQADQRVDRSFHVEPVELIAPQHIHTALSQSGRRSLLWRVQPQESKAPGHYLLSVGDDTRPSWLVPLSAEDHIRVESLLQKSAGRFPTRSHQVQLQQPEGPCAIQLTESALDLLEGPQITQKPGYQPGTRDTVTLESKGTDDNVTMEKRGTRDRVTKTGIPGRDTDTITLLGSDDSVTIEIRGGRDIVRLDGKGPRDAVTGKEAPTRDHVAIFNLLIKLLSGSLSTAQYQISSDELFISDLQSQEMVEEDSPLAAEPPVSWDMEKIMRNCNISPAKQKDLLDWEINVQALVSLLLYVSSSQGEGLNIGFVVSRLLEEPEGMGGLFAELAGLSPAAIATCLEDSLSGRRSRSSLWNVVMGDANRDKLRALAVYLGIALQENSLYNK